MCPGSNGSRPRKHQEHLRQGSSEKASDAAPEGRLWLRVTPRQRRIRVWAGLLMVVLLSLVYVGLTNPFFRGVGDARVRSLTRVAMAARREGRTPPAAAERARRAVVARLMVIGAYWAVCLGLSAVLVLLAVKDLRELQKSYWRAHLQAAERETGRLLGRTQRGN